MQNENVQTERDNSTSILYKIKLFFNTNLFNNNPSLKYTLPVIGVLIITSGGLLLMYNNNYSIEVAQNNYPIESTTLVVTTSTTSPAQTSTTISREIVSQPDVSVPENTNRPKKEISKTITFLPNAQSSNNSKSFASIGVMPQSLFVKATNKLLTYFGVNVVSADSDNTSIAYMKFTDNMDTDIWVYSLPLNIEKKLISSEINESYPEFSPDSSKISFETTRYFNVNTSRSSASNENKYNYYDIISRQIITPDVKSSSSPVWSPDGRYLADRKYLYDLKYSKTYPISQIKDGRISYPSGSYGISFSTDSSKIFSVYSWGDGYYIDEYDLYTDKHTDIITAEKDRTIDSVMVIGNKLTYKESGKSPMIDPSYANIKPRIIVYDLDKKEKIKTTNYISDFNIKSVYSFLLDNNGDIKVLIAEEQNDDKARVEDKIHLYKVINGKAEIIQKSIGEYSTLVGWLGTTNKALLAQDSFPQNQDIKTRVSLRVVDLESNSISKLVDGIATNDTIYKSAK